MDIIITGISGHLGNLLRQSKIINFIELPKNSTRNSNFMNFEVEKILVENNYLIHAAWNMESRNLETSYEINVKGSLNLIEKLENIKFDFSKFIFISTINANHDSKSVYENHKYAIEKIILEKGGYVIKPGLVYDKKDPFSGGFVKNLYTLASKYPFLPNFTAEREIYYLASSEKILEIVEQIIKNEKLTSREFKIFDIGPLNYKSLVNNFMNLNKAIINIPWLIGFMAARFFEILKINFPVKSDSLMALK